MFADDNTKVSSGYPSVPAAAVDLTGGAVEFLCFELRAQGAYLDGLAGIIRPQASGFVAPRTVGINKLDKPKGRLLLTI